MTLSELLCKVGSKQCRDVSVNQYGTIHKLVFLIITSVIFRHVSAIHAGPYVGPPFCEGGGAVRVNMLNRTKSAPDFCYL